MWVIGLQKDLHCQNFIIFLLYRAMEKHLKRLTVLNII